MINAVHQSEYGAFLALDPHLGEKVIAQISDHVSNFRRMDKPACGLCSPRLRPHLKKFTERNHPSLTILSYQEIVPQIKVQSIGIITND